MATSCTGSSSLAPCAYCQNEGNNLADPRILPCGHVFCLRCMWEALENQESSDELQCPICRKKHHISSFGGLESLPTALLSDDTNWSNATSFDDRNPDHYCDSCLYAGINTCAIYFCCDCYMEMCEAHFKSHTGLSVTRDHTVVSIGELSTLKKKLLPRYCSEHKSRYIDGVCVKCKKLLCPMCWTEAPLKYDRGERHDVRPLNGVSKQIRQQLEEAAKPIVDNQQILRDLINQSNQTCDEATAHIDNMIPIIHQTLNEQIEEIKNIYMRLEDQVVAAKATILKQKSDYEQKLHEEISRLQSFNDMVAELLSWGHNVDIILRGEKTLQSLTNPQTVRMEPIVIKHIELIPIRQNRLAELALTVRPPVQQTGPPTVPNGLSCAERVITKGACYSVCHCKDGRLIAGQETGFDFIFGNRVIDRRVDIMGAVHGNVFANDAMFALKSHNGKRQVRIYGLDGQLQRCWPGTDCADAGNLAVVGELVFVPNATLKLLNVYNLTGQELYTITNPSFESPNKLAAAGSHHILVSDMKAGLVSKFTIRGGQVEWQYSGLPDPSGVALDEYGRTWVASYEQNCIHGLSREGELIVELELEETKIHGISIQGRQLAVATGKKELRLYTITS